MSATSSRRCVGRWRDDPAVKLLLFGPWEPESPGGPGTVALHLSRSWVASGHEVLVVAGAPRSTAVTRPPSGSPGVEVARVPLAGRLPLLHPATRHLIDTHTRDADAAVLLSVFTPFHAAVGRRLPCPYAVAPLGGYAHESIRARGRTRKRALLVLAERRLLEQAALVNVWSLREQRDVELICRPERVVVTPPGLPEGCTFPEHPAPRGPGRHLLYLGRFAPDQKGLDQLVQAFTIAGGPDDRLTLAGVDHGGGLARLQRQVAASPARDRIEIRGPAWGEEKAELFAAHDAFVHLSRWEGLPLAVVEALASGLPVVVTEATNVAELVESHGAGWVATGDGTGALRDALGASDVDLITAGRSAQRMARAEFDWDRAAGTLLAALTESRESIG